MTNHERIQRAVDRRLDTLHVSAPAFSPVSFTPRRRFHPFRRVIAVAAVAAVTFVGSVSVLAASFPPIQRLVEQVGVQLASIMQTVELSCVSDDIEMQVLAMTINVLPFIFPCVTRPVAVLTKRPFFPICRLTERWAPATFSWSIMTPAQAISSIACPDTALTR